MSDLAKRVADKCRSEAEFSRALGDGTPKAEKRATRHERLAAFIESAQASRLALRCNHVNYIAPYKACGCRACSAAKAQDAALIDLAQAMEVSDD